MPTQTYSRAGWLNLAAFILHLCVFVGVLIWILSSYNAESPGIPTSLFSLVPMGSDGTIKIQQTAPDAPWAIPVLILVFEAVTLFAHFVYFVFPTWYEGMLDKSNNWARWVEYAISSSLMVAIIALSVGVRSFDTIITICLINCVVMLMGDLIEKQLAAKTDPSGQSARASTILAWTLFFTVWYNLAASFTRIVEDSDSKVPAFVSAVFVCMLLCYGSFGVVQAVQLSGGLTDYRKVESTYITLSFVTKIILSFLVVSGMIARPPQKQISDTNNTIKKAHRTGGEPVTE
jgi:hypothetical protein